MVTTAPEPQHSRPKRRRTKQQRQQRRAIIAAGAVIALFVVALILFVGPSLTGDGDNGAPLPSGVRTSDPSVTPSGIATPDASPSGTPTAADGLPALPGLTNGSGSPNLPNTTNLNALGPGDHRVVLTAKSDATMLAVAYSIKGGKTGKVFYNVKSPVVIARTLSGGRPYAAVALQLAPTATYGSCIVTIDGKVVNTQSSKQPYAVIGCVG